jgi:hypothetical protein
MNKIVKTVAATALAASFSFGAANATTFVFKGDGNNVTPLGSEGVDFEKNCGSVGTDFCSTGDHEDGLNYSLDGIGLKVIATADGEATRVIQDIYPGDSGLGAYSENNMTDDQTQADSTEALEFYFDSEVSRTDVEFNAGGDVSCSSFGSEGPCGDFNLTIDGVFMGALTATDNIAFLGTGMHFVLQAITAGAGFTIAQFTIPDDVQAVPTPAALPLLLSGILGLGFASRRRRDAAALR